VQARHGQVDRHPRAVPLAAQEEALSRRQAALLDAAQHWALRVETCQEAQADASRAVSVALDWSALARGINQRTDFYAARPWLRRVVA